ncbi:MAG TPA: DNA-processing protein DprA [Bacillota bacterium]|jgi:DNA processing protein|nr:DNA-processing protein DprA [Bacillota bacterium]
MKITDEENRIKAISIDNDGYPELLRVIENPPEVLYYIGDLGICSTLCLAVVGARKATPYGKWAAYNISKLTAEHGVTIISGMASGIDTCGHLGALAAGGSTIAVLGCGPDICYPRTNRELMNKIAQQGLILSEYPPGRGPHPGQFPVRNRIISALSYGVLVVEAGLSSGSLITAGHALNQGKEVFAVPGNINCIYSAGTNRLIRDGAMPVTAIDEIPELLGIRKIRPKEEEDSLLGEDEKVIYELVAVHGTVTLDRLCLLSGKQPAAVGALVTILEIKGRLQTTMGKIHVAKY